MNKILEKKQELRRCLFSIILLKKKKQQPIHIMGKASWLQRKKKTMHTQEMHNLEILYAKITLLSSKKEEYFLQKS